MSYTNEAEQYILGAILYDSELLEHCKDLTPQSFISDHHLEIYRAIEALSTADQPVNFQTVPEQMQKHSYAPDREYILNLTDNAVDDVETFLFNLGTVLESRRSVNMADVLAKHLERARNPSIPTAQVQAELESALDGFERITDEREPRTLKETTHAAIKQIEERFENSDKMVGLTTGLKELDQVTGGFKGKQNIVVAGRSGTGKTAFMLTLLEHMASDEKAQGSWIYVASYEMEGEELSERLLSSMGKIDSDRIRSGKLQRDDFAAMTAAAKRMFGMNVYIDDVKGSSIYDLRNRIKRLAKKYGPPAGIMMDYIQLLKAAGRQNMIEKLEDASWQVKELASKYQCPFIQLAQVNRGCEQRNDKRPMASDLKGSGAIEQDADIVIMLYRDEVYNPDTTDKGIAEVNLVKHRGGECKTIRVQYIGKYTRFEDLPAGAY